MLERREQHIEYRKIEIDFDIRRQHRNLVANIKKSSTYVQEAGAGIANIKQLTKKLSLKKK